MLTNAMRILAGQVPHRDFYAVYGPADYYLPAALFKLFGESVLASRLLDLFIEALTVVSVYAITSVYCRRAVCLCAATVTLLWFYGLEGEIGGTVFPVALLSLVSSAILIPLFAGKVSKLQLGMAGTIAGLSALYRYDTGVAILGVQISVIAIACYLSADKGPLRATNFASTLWPYLLGFGILTVPPAIYFFSVSPAYPLLLDVVILQARYYHRGRNLPFPRIHLAYLEQLAVYLPIFAVGLAVSFMAVRIYRKHRGAANKLQPSSTELQWRGLLVTLGLLAFVMFFKGFIRVGIVPMFVSLLPSLVIAAGFFDRRMTFSRPVRGFITALASFFVLVSILSAHAEAVHQWKERSVPGRIMRTLFFPNRPSPGIQATWCKLSNPITRGFCFLTDQGRVGHHQLPDCSHHTGRADLRRTQATR